MGRSLWKATWVGAYPWFLQLPPQVTLMAQAALSRDKHTHSAGRALLGRQLSCFLWKSLMMDKAGGSESEDNALHLSN